MDYRDTEEELKYYGSDYNKFINKECPHTHTCNNIDVIQYKRSSKILRICESKHMNEHMPGTQLEILELVTDIFKSLNEVQKECTYEIFIVTGNPPYEQANIQRLINRENINVSRDELIEFSSFFKTFEELYDPLGILTNAIK